MKDMKTKPYGLFYQRTVTYTIRLRVYNPYNICFSLIFHTTLPPQECSYLNLPTIKNCRDNTL